MKLSELIARYGDDNVQFQNLDQAIISLSMNKGVTKITFGAEQPCGLDGLEKLAIVVWMDRDKVKKLLADAKGGGNG